MLLGSGESSDLLLLPAEWDFTGAGVLNWDCQRSLEQLVQVNGRCRKGTKEDAVSPEGITCCLWCPCLAWQCGCQCLELQRGALSSQPSPPARLTNGMWPLQVVQKPHGSWQRNWCKVLFFEKTSFFPWIRKILLLLKETKAGIQFRAGAVFKTSSKHTVLQYCWCIKWEHTLCESKWLLYLDAIYMWVLIKKDVLN